MVNCITSRYTFCSKSIHACSTWVRTTSWLDWAIRYLPLPRPQSTIGILTPICNLCETCGSLYASENSGSRAGNPYTAKRSALNPLSDLSLQHPCRLRSVAVHIHHLGIIIQGFLKCLAKIRFENRHVGVNNPVQYLLFHYIQGMNAGGTFPISSSRVASFSAVPAFR
jgi:hypothetical protein